MLATDLVRPRDKKAAMFRGQSSGEDEAEAESGGERAVSRDGLF